ncbi:MAG: hypothetical protein OEV06_01180 [Anaerolineae bacterium]|nr:hypothetical protein [Anaerolineae bacterium]
MADNHGIKLLMTWDIRAGREEDYFEFHIRKFLPTLEKLGVKLSEAWLTVYGVQPRMMAEANLNSLKSAHAVLYSQAWDELGLELDDFVENFNIKLIKADAGFQI